jgi:hypothetical protein
MKIRVLVSIISVCVFIGMLANTHTIIESNENLKNKIIANVPNDCAYIIGVGKEEYIDALKSVILTEYSDKTLKVVEPTIISSVQDCFK